jgi:hypothetical protein
MFAYQCAGSTSARFCGAFLAGQRGSENGGEVSAVTFAQPAGISRPVGINALNSGKHSESPTKKIFQSCVPNFFGKASARLSDTCSQTETRHIKRGPASTHTPPHSGNVVVRSRRITSTDDNQASKRLPNEIMQFVSSLTAAAFGVAGGQVRGLNKASVATFTLAQPTDAPARRAASLLDNGQPSKSLPGKIYRFHRQHLHTGVMVERWCWPQTNTTYFIT